MPIKVILHISGEEPIIGEIGEMPNPGDTLLTVSNPSKRDGKELPYLDRDVTVVIWPWDKINFLEIVPSEAEEEIIGFVRE